MAPQESDSHYRMKYPHTQSTRIAIPRKHDVPARIQTRIEEVCSWYYQLYYPQRTRPPS
jgi:sulfotransferase